MRTCLVCAKVADQRCDPVSPAAANAMIGINIFGAVRDDLPDAPAGHARQIERWQGSVGRLFARSRLLGDNGFRRAQNTARVSDSEPRGEW